MMYGDNYDGDTWATPFTLLVCICIYLLTFLAFLHVSLPLDVFFLTHMFG